MAKKIGSCGQFLRIIFIFLNIFFSVIGLGIIAAGIYLVVTGGTYDFITGNEYASGVPILIVSGVVTLIIAIIGLIAGITLWWPLFLIYGFVLLLVVVLEVVAGILGFVYQTRLEDFYSSRFNGSIFRYENGSTSAVNQFVDAVQSNFMCCGVDNPDNWLESTFYLQNRRFPDSCSSGCNSSNSNCITLEGINVHSMGCNGTFFSFIEQNAAAIGGVGLAFGLFEVMGVILSFVLCGCVFAKRNSDDYYT